MTDSGMTDNELTDLVLDALDDLKAVDPKLVDVRGLSSVMDFLVVASGNSARHVKSLAENVVLKAKGVGCMTWTTTSPKSTKTHSAVFSPSTPIGGQPTPLALSTTFSANDLT